MPAEPPPRVHVNGKANYTHAPSPGDIVTFPDYPAYAPRRITSTSVMTKDGITWTSHHLANVEHTNPQAHASSSTRTQDTQP